MAYKGNQSFGYGSPNESNTNPRPEFERNTDGFGLSFAQSVQNRPELDLTGFQNKKMGEIGQNKVQSIGENLPFNPFAQDYTEAKIPEGMPDNMKAVVKAMQFDPTSTQSVMNLQNNLNNAGYTDSDGQPLKPDGRFGPKTANAKAMLARDADIEMKQMEIQDMRSKAEQQHRIREMKKRQEELAMLRIKEEARAYRKPEGSGGGKQTDPKAIKSSLAAAEQAYAPQVDEISEQIRRTRGGRGFGY